MIIKKEKLSKSTNEGVPFLLKFNFLEKII